MDSKRRKTRRIRGVTRKWNHLEEVEVLEYLQNYLKRNNDGAVQLSANQFFEQMSDAVKFDTISSSQIRNKIRNLHQKYLKAVDMKTKIGCDLDLATLESNVLAVCPHYHSLHEIFGTAASTRLPFQFSSNCAIDKDEYDTFDIKVEPNAYYDDTENSDLSGDGPNQSFDAHNGDMDSIDADELLTDNNKHQSMGSMFIPSIALNDSEPRTSEHRRPRERYNSDQNNTSRRLHPYAIKNDQDALARDRFEFEKEMRIKELELKKYSIDNDRRVRIMQLEKDERMERLRLELNFKVQMARIGKDVGDGDSSASTNYAT